MGGAPWWRLDTWRSRAQSSHAAGDDRLGDCVLTGKEVLERSYELIERLSEPPTLLTLPGRFAVLDQIADMWAHWGGDFFDESERSTVTRFNGVYIREIHRTDEFAASPEAFEEARRLLERTDLDVTPVVFTAVRPVRHADLAGWGPDLVLGILLTGYTAREEYSPSGEHLLVRAPTALYGALSSRSTRARVGNPFPAPSPTVWEALTTLWDPFNGPYQDLGEALLAAELLAR